jgi:hypothetical protein
MPLHIFFKTTYKHVALFCIFGVGDWPKTQTAVEDPEQNNLL